LYSWHYAIISHFQQRSNSRLFIMAILATIWGIRLTFNFYRKGGYSLKAEDYRWDLVRAKMKEKCGVFYPITWQIFNILFIALYQNLLFVLWTLPSYDAFLSKTPLNFIDLLGTCAFLTFLVTETVADQQQFNFQTAKHKAIHDRETLTGEFADGFLQSGLFRYSRHPNFFGEISLWWSYYLFSIASSSALLNWSVIGVFLLTLLFQGSTNFTESISTQKYPKYKEYQKTTSRIIPWFNSQQKKNK